MSNAIIIDTPAQIARFTLASLRGRLRLESVGMRGRGQSARVIAKRFGYTGTVAEIISAISADLAK